MQPVSQSPEISANRRVESMFCTEKEYNHSEFVLCSCNFLMCFLPFSHITSIRAMQSTFLRCRLSKFPPAPLTCIFCRRTRRWQGADKTLYLVAECCQVVHACNRWHDDATACAHGQSYPYGRTLHDLGESEWDSVIALVRTTRSHWTYRAEVIQEALLHLLTCYYLSIWKHWANSKFYVGVLLSRVAPLGCRTHMPYGTSWQEMPRDLWRRDIECAIAIL